MKYSWLSEMIKEVSEGAILRVTQARLAFLPDDARVAFSDDQSASEPADWQVVYFEGIE